MAKLEVSLENTNGLMVERGIFFRQTEPFKRFVLILNRVRFQDGYELLIIVSDEFVTVQHSNGAIDLDRGSYCRL